MPESDECRPRDLALTPIAPVRQVRWRQLLRAPRLALDFRKCALGAFGLILTKVGWDGLSALFGSTGWTAPELIHPFPNALGSSPAETARRLAAYAAEPLWIPVSPLLGALGIHIGAATFVLALSSALWALAVWSIVGGAISRITALELTTGQKISLGVAMRFAAKRTLSLVGAPFGALFGLGIFAAFCAVFGLLYRIPSIGPTIGGVLFFAPLIFGFVMALILAGLVMGWPLMVATVAVESEDAFDAMSRSSGYIQQRTGRFLAYWLLAWVLGILGLIVVALFAWLLVHMAAWGVAFGAPDELILNLLHDAHDGPDAWPVRIHAGWARLVGLLVNGFSPAFFWSSATIIYLLLRHDVDGAPWEGVWQDRTEETLVR
jgi:hypothetical protein